MNEYMSPITPTIIVEDDLDCDLYDDDSSSQTKDQNSNSSHNELNGQRQSKQLLMKNSKSHRLIEKRRRDRMNYSLDALLHLIPHKKPDNQRRIEKTEIVEMAIKYIRCLLASNHKPFEPIRIEKKINSKVEVYRTGYYNGMGDMFEHVEKHENDRHLLTTLAQYVQQKEVELKDLVVVSERKSNLKLPKPIDSQSDTDYNAFSISDVKPKEENRNTSSDKPISSIQQSKVPIFVLHPSGTHYIPMFIDSSAVANAFKKKSDQTQKSSVDEQLHCHPVSIPVNFNPTPNISEHYELDIQNINVVSARHQPSVRPE